MIFGFARRLAKDGLYTFFNKKQYTEERPDFTFGSQSLKVFTVVLYIQPSTRTSKIEIQAGFGLVPNLLGCMQLGYIPMYFPIAYTLTS